MRTCIFFSVYAHACVLPAESKKKPEQVESGRALVLSVEEVRRARVESVQALFFSYSSVLPNQIADSSSYLSTVRQLNAYHSSVQAELY